MFKRPEKLLEEVRIERARVAVADLELLVRSIESKIWIQMYAGHDSLDEDMSFKCSMDELVKLSEALRDCGYHSRLRFVGRQRRLYVSWKNY